MRECAILIAAICFVSGCASNTGTSARATSQDHHSGLVTGIGNDSGTRGSNHQSNLQASRSENRTEARSTENAGRSASISSETSDTVEIPLYREELQVGKREVSAGGVLLRKVVETQSTNAPVQLRREEIVIERVKADDARAQNRSGDVRAFEDREVTIELHREVPVVGKNAVVSEVVRARKTTGSERQTITDTVRREEIDIAKNMANIDANEAAGGAATASTERASSGDRNREERDSAEMTLHREQLEVGKRQVESGRVVLKKNVTSEQVSRPVELRTEDVKIERGAAREVNADDARAAFENQEIYIPLTREVAVKEKETRLVEVVRARKQVETDQQTVTGQVRHERVEVVRNEASGGPATRATGSNDSQEREARGDSNNRAAEISANAKADANANANLNWGDREKFAGTITMVNPETRKVTVRNEQGQTRTFTFNERPTLVLKENRAPQLVNFHVGYPVTIGHRGDNADLMIRADAPEVR